MGNGAAVEYGYAAVPEFATIQLPLTTHITASELVDLLSGLASLHREFVEVDQRIAGYTTHVAPVLEVVLLQIGTPNWIKVLGRGNHMLKVATLLSAILAVPMTGAETYRIYREAEKFRVETTMLQAQTGATELEIRIKEFELLAKTQEALKNKSLSKEEHRELQKQVVDALEALHRGLSIIDVSRKKEMRFAPSSDGPHTPPSGRP